MIVYQSANVVIVPVSAQIGQLNQLWLYKNGILSEDAQGIFTPVAVQATDADVELLLLQNRLQVQGRQPAFADALQLATTRAQLLINAAGSSVLGALTGVGLNVQLFWNQHGQSDPGTLLERAFLKEGTVVSRLSSDRKLGISIVEFIDGIKLTTKIEHAQNDRSGEPGIGMDANVHADLVDVSAVSAFLNRANEYANYIQERVALIENEILAGEA